MNKKTIKKLESLADNDQRAISNFKSGHITGNDLAIIQQKNTDLVKSIIKKEGFPFRDIASERAYLAAFLAIQHSGDLVLMEETINLFSSVNDSKIKKAHLALLIDRFLMFQNKPQRFGTQYVKNKKNNKYELYKIDKSVTDQERTNYNVPPLKEAIEKEREMNKDN